MYRARHDLIKLHKNNFLSPNRKNIFSNNDLLRQS